jgi:hypothetical protein
MTAVTTEATSSGLTNESSEASSAITSALMVGTLLLESIAPVNANCNTSDDNTTVTVLGEVSKFQLSNTLFAFDTSLVDLATFTPLTDSEFSLYTSCNQSINALLRVGRAAAFLFVTSSASLQAISFDTSVTCNSILVVFAFLTVNT